MSGLVIGQERKEQPRLLSNSYGEWIFEASCFLEHKGGGLLNLHCRSGSQGSGSVQHYHIGENKALLLNKHYTGL